MTGLETIAGRLSMSVPVLVLALAAVGLGSGIASGLFGVGGAFLATPLLNVLFGVPYPLAVGSSLSFTIGASASGWARHLRMRHVEPWCMGLLTVGSTVGVIGGAWLNRTLARQLGGDVSKQYELVMHGLFVAMLAVTAIMVARVQPAEPGRRSFLQRVSLRPRIRLRAAGLAGVSVPGMLLIGGSIGVATGLLGIGGGVLLVPALILAVGLTAHQAVGTSLGVVMFSAIVGTVNYGLTGGVNLWVVMSLLVGSTFGVQIGAWLCSRLRQQRLRRYFAALVLLVAATIALDIVRKLLGP